MGRPRNLQKAVSGLRMILQRFSPHLHRQKALVAGSFLALFAEMALRLLEPWPLKVVIDGILGADRNRLSTPLVGAMTQNTPSLLAAAAVALLAIVGLRSLAGYWSTVGFAVIGNRVLADIRSELYQHVQALSLTFHNRARTGDLVVRMIGDVNMLRDVAVTAVLPLAANLLILTGMLAVMFWLNWRLALIAVIMAPLFALSAATLSGRIQEAARTQRVREGAIAATAAESIGAIANVQALSLETVFARVFLQNNRRSLKEAVKTSRLAAALERRVDVLIAAATALVLWYGGHLALRGVLTAGDLIVFLAYLKNAFKPMQDFAKYTGRLAKASAAGERVLELLERTPEVSDAPDAAPAPPFAGAVRFESVSFGYQPGVPVLNGISFDVRPGHRVAVVGPSGSGKSTLVALLLRLYDPTVGRVLIDGHDVRSYTVVSVRHQISVVLQDSLLFAASVRENIAYGSTDAGPEDIAAAAYLANAHEFIAALPERAETVIGERGVTLSRGQRQRIAIARAAVRRAPILVLDEPTAGLDEENERVVTEALDRLSAGRTTFLVTHDFRRATGADLILFLDGGRVPEQGTHEELMSRDGRYAAMFQLQTTTRVGTAPTEAGHAVVR